MNIQEVKLKLITSVNRLIDTYFGSPNLTEKMINATLKVLVKQNSYKVDGMLSMFTDANGEINPQDILMEYANQIGDNGVIIDIKQYVNNETLKQLIPNKALVITKEDILNLVI
jgi:NADPH-dependent curcumin reductase CurA